MRVSVVDYGTGNMGSWKSFLRGFDVDVTISSELSEITADSVILLPGVGSACEAMDFLKKSGGDKELQKRAEHGQPLIGVCLGAQLLLGKNEEMNGRALGIVPGTTKRVSNGARFNTGWDQIVVGDGFVGSQIEQFNREGRFYFNHQYGLHPSVSKDHVAEGLRTGLIALFRVANVWGIQFHPEKSQQSGQDFFGAVLREIRNDDV